MAKIQFSVSEMELMTNADVILTKNRIIEKLKGILASVQETMVSSPEVSGEPALQPYFSIPPKISKGENYNGLPYLILDYPRYFKPEGIFALRTMFWWGHFFSVTLHISGIEKLVHMPKVVNAYHLLAQHEYYIGINPNPWEHHFEPSNYISISSLSKEAFAETCHKAAHIKIAAKWPLHYTPSAANNIVVSWKQLLKICAT